MSGARTAIRIPAYSSTANIASTTIAPISPSSSPMIAKMKSLWAFGQVVPLLAAVAQAHAEPAAGAERDQSLDQLVAGALRVRHRG